MENKKKPPTWGYVVGILGILFGACGLLGATYELLMPMMFEMQEQMMVSMQEAAETAEKERATKEPCPEESNRQQSHAEQMAAFESMRKMLDRPPWHRTWSLINGGLAGLLGAAYMLAAIFLILVKPWAPTLFLSIAGASMLRNIISFSVGIASGSFLMFWSVSSAVMGFLVDLVLVIVVLVSDKSDYKT